ncbi:MAG: NusG domain II-containing protein [Gallionellaceae bacterium]|jgi:hypothetical protein|nr:NusG domain II-containing protein [Gallionellaceae bacterium]
MLSHLSLPQIKPGDWFTLFAGMAGVAFLAATLWQGGAADKAVIRSGGKIFREASLATNQTIDVPGPLGVTHIAITDRRVRVASDPSPRQYCVRQGWIAQAGEIAICLPNQVSVELRGRQRNYDSLNY